MIVHLPKDCDQEGKRIPGESFENIFSLAQKLPRSPSTTFYSHTHVAFLDADAVNLSPSNTNWTHLTLLFLHPTADPGVRFTSSEKSRHH